MLQLIAFMRALEYTRANDSPELRLYDLQGKVGQEPHQIPSVFHISNLIMQLQAISRLRLSKVRKREF
jgi:hypothetical protein